MTPSDLQKLLKDFYLERLALLLQHEVAARSVGDYDVNNAYQYIISREETHISWLQHALLDVGIEIPPDPSIGDVAPVGTRRHKDVSDEKAFEAYGADARNGQQFVDKWRDRVEQVTDARHRGMLRVILGEMLEHRRLFEQAAQGRTDIIGTHLAVNERRGRVINTRWLE